MHLTNEQIERILQGCRLNERRAQKELYSAYYAYAISIALRYASSYDNAVEMTNDAFLKVYRDLKRFVPRFDNTTVSFRAWLKKVVINASIDHIRKYNKKEILAGVDAREIIIADTRETPEQMLEHKEIIKYIHQLSPTYKAVFNLYVIEGYSHAEIARKLNTSEGCSKSHFYKAKQNLRQLIANNHEATYKSGLTKPVSMEG